MATTYSKVKKSYYELGIIPELLKLMKPRVMSLVIFTCAVGLLTAPTSVSFQQSVFGIPRGKLNRNQALYFGTSLSVISVVSLYFVTNALSAFLLLFTILFYVFVYTIWLKRKTPQNIVIGGASGALPPVIGWAIATNSISFESIAFFLIIFFWTPSHFWALSLYKADDYKKAGIPMLPVTNGIQDTKKNILIYSLLMIPTIVFPYYIGFVGEVFLTLSLLLTFYYNLICYQLYNYKVGKFNIKKARHIFSYSIIYLFLIFVFFLVDKVL